MKYVFPLIKHINDVRDFIKDKDEFKIFRREGFLTVNYMVSNEETFPSPVKSREHSILREIRGLKFCEKSGEILQRPFHKFFNLNEKEETKIENIDFDEPHTVLEKLDGSMVAPIIIDDCLRLTTKAGITDVSMQAEAFMAKNPIISEYCREIVSHGYTPIFEYISPDNRIVINYEEEDMVLLAIRNILTGEYLPRYVMEGDLPEEMSIVKEHKVNGKSIQEIKDIVSKSQSEEGVILRFHDGHMLKVKSEWYCRLHRMKELMSNEKNLLKIILAQEADDLKSFLSPEDRERVTEFESNFWKSYYSYIGELQNVFHYYFRVCEGSRKRFAIEHSKEIPSANRNHIFALFNGKDVEEVVFNFIEKSLHRREKYDNMKEVLEFEGFTHG